MGKIAVGMSGGVDSSVSALLLKDAGYDVIGITMLLRPALKGESSESLLKESSDAALVCRELGIKHYTVDYRAEFKDEIIDNFTGEYCGGRTPNPCVLCNSSFKFGRLLDYALTLGCSSVATGHYAVIEKVGERFLLKKADSPKDQSYFLYTLNQHQLSHAVFPLFFKDKQEARALARLRGLPTAEKGDSQDVCFIKNGDYVDFLKSGSVNLPPRGSFIDIHGSTIGCHGGIHNYTVGQRKGLGSFGKPMFVKSIDSAQNTVTLCEKGQDLRSELLVNRVNFIPFDFLQLDMKVTVKLRYRARPVSATITNAEGGQVKVQLEEPQPMITPGQSAVFYNGDTVVGGGIIM